MPRQANALRPASVKLGGTSRLSRIASWISASNWSSSHMSGIPGASDLRPLRRGERAQGGGVAHPVQATAPLRADAADFDRQLVADLFVRQWWVADQQRQQLPAAVGELGERGPDRGVQLRGQDFLLSQGC